MQLACITDRGLQLSHMACMTDVTGPNKGPAMKLTVSCALLTSLPPQSRSSVHYLPSAAHLHMSRRLPAGPAVHAQTSAQQRADMFQSRRYGLKVTAAAPSKGQVQDHMMRSCRMALRRMAEQTLETTTCDALLQLQACRYTLRSAGPRADKHAMHTCCLILLHSSCSFSSSRGLGSCHHTPCCPAQPDVASLLLTLPLPELVLPPFARGQARMPSAVAHTHGRSLAGTPVRAVSLQAAAEQDAARLRACWTCWSRYQVCRTSSSPTCSQHTQSLLWYHVVPCIVHGSHFANLLQGMQAA